MYKIIFVSYNPGEFEGAHALGMLPGQFQSVQEARAHILEEEIPACKKDFLEDDAEVAAITDFDEEDSVNGVIFTTYQEGSPIGVTEYEIHKV